MDNNKNIIITCCGDISPSLKAVSVSEKSNRSLCGEIPCNSVPSVGPSCKTCSPDFASATLEEKCYPQRYLTRVSSIPDRDPKTGKVIGSITKTTSWAVGGINSESCVGINEGFGYNYSVCGNLSIGGYSNVYSNPSPIGGDPDPKAPPMEFPPYPEFIEPCSSSSTSSLLRGQNRGSSFIKNLNRDSIQKKEATKCKYRIEHLPIITNYLKVWIRKRITNKYQWAVPPGETCPRWVSIPGTYPQFSELSPYIWESSSPFIESPTCSDTIISNTTEINALPGEEAFVEIYKYSYVRDYTPDDPDPKTGVQSCRPNGWPLLKC